MMGCCGAEAQTFNTEDGTQVPILLDTLIKKLRAQGWTDAQLDRVRKCDCPCHDAGPLKVLC